MVQCARILQRESVNILIYNHKPVEILGIKTFLLKEYDSISMESIDNDQRFFEKMNTQAFDLIIIDINTLSACTEGNLLALIENIKAKSTEVPILVMGDKNPIHIALWALNVGATGYIDMACDGDAFLFAVSQILRGKKYLQPSIAEQVPLVLNRVGGFYASIDRLSKRECQVMWRISRGESITEIGHRMGLSVKTISTYKARIMEKLNIQSNYELIQYIVWYNKLTSFEDDRIKIPVQGTAIN